jgi:hypothetical protein
MNLYYNFGRLFLRSFSVKNVASTQVKLSAVMELQAGQTSALPEIGVSWNGLSHISIHAMHCLNLHFPGHWIGHRGQQMWPLWLFTPSISLTSLNGSMNTRHAQLRTHWSHCRFNHIFQWLRNISVCYFLSHEKLKNAYQSWRWTFWRFVTAVKVKIMEHHVQPLSVNSCCSKYICHVHIWSIH